MVSGVPMQKQMNFEQQLWDADTYREWMRIVREGEGDKAGLGVSDTFHSYTSGDLNHGVR